MIKDKITNAFWRTLEKYRIELLIIIFSSLCAIAILFAIKALSLLSESEILFFEILLATMVLIISMVLITIRKIDYIAENVGMLGINTMQSTSLLGPGGPWFTGAELIKELGAGDVLLASTSVSWPLEATAYINANKFAMKNGLVVKRLYANDDYNNNLAIEQSSWGRNLEGRVYSGKLPLLDYVLAINDGNPQWAVLWIYAPEKATLLYGLLIKDYRPLQSLKEDFYNKWGDSMPIKKDN